MNTSDSCVTTWRLFGAAAILWLSGCSTCAQLNARYLSGGSIFITPLQTESASRPLRLAVKDNIDVKGVVTTAGSRALVTQPPAAEDAPCLAIARERNVQIVGKANLSEFAVSPSGINEFFGTPRNPFSIWGTRIPGGSSSGSAVAIAAGLADVAFGTDTAGSIRVPAACCGIVGLKTTHGLISTKGIYPIEPQHLDTVGPMGKDIASVVVGMDLLERDFIAKYAAAKAAHPTARSIRIGRVRLPDTDRRVDAAIDTALLLSGFQVVPLDGDFVAKWEQAKRDGNTVAAAGAWISGQKYQYSLGVSLRTKAVLLTGRLNHSKYQQALSRREQWQKTLRDTFQKVDFIAMPTLQGPPFTKFAGGWDVGLLEARVLQLQNTVPVNYAGNPAVAVPIPLRRTGFALGSLQLIGPERSEAELLNAARFVESTVHPSKRVISYDRLCKGCSSEAAAAILRADSVTRTARGASFDVNSSIPIADQIRSRSHTTTGAESVVQ
jgi:amidase